MERHASTILENPVVNAISIGVYRGGVAFTGHYGELDPGAGNRPTDATIYEIASVTKTFTGTLVAQAVLDGKFTLDTDVRELLAGDYPNLAFEGEPVRIRHLITHTAGLPANNKPLEDLSGDNADGTLWREIYEAEKGYTKAAFLEDLKTVELTTKPGTDFLYSNVSANLMGHILERVYGKTFGELLDEKVFSRAGMTETWLHLPNDEETRLAGGYNGEGLSMPRLPLADTLWGAEGALKSTLPDMMRYAESQLDDERPLVQELRQKFKKLDDGYWIGYFWWVVDVEDVVQGAIESYQHNGGAIGTRSVFLVYPSYDMAIYVVTNNASETIFPALSALAEALLGDLRPSGAIADPL